jgi:hypothetical protein
MPSLHGIAIWLQRRPNGLLDEWSHNELGHLRFGHLRDADPHYPLRRAASVRRGPSVLGRTVWLRRPDPILAQRSHSTGISPHAQESSSRASSFVPENPVSRIVSIISGN